MTIGMSPVVYPIPVFVNLMEETWVSAFIVAIADAAVPAPTGPEIVTKGTVEYPTPLSDTTIEITPKLDVCMLQVAAAPTPFPPLIVIVGATVYPIPAFVSKILSIE